MHRIYFRTKFTFGDLVQFNQDGMAGTGTIEVITIDGRGHHDYMIYIEENGMGAYQPGIEEQNITLLKAARK